MLRAGQRKRMGVISYGARPEGAAGAVRRCPIIRLRPDGKRARECGALMDSRPASALGCENCDRHGKEDFVKSQTVDFSGEVSTLETYLDFMRKHPHNAVWTVDRDDGSTWKDVLERPVVPECFAGAHDQCRFQDWELELQPEVIKCGTCCSTYHDEAEVVDPETGEVRIESCWHEDSIPSDRAPGMMLCPVCGDKNLGKKWMSWCWPDDALVMRAEIARRRHQQRLWSAGPLQGAGAAAPRVPLQPKASKQKIKPDFPVTSRGAWLIDETGPGSAAKWELVAKTHPFKGDKAQCHRFEKARADKLDRFEETPKEEGKWWEVVDQQRVYFEGTSRRDDLAETYTERAADNAYALEKYAIVGQKVSRRDGFAAAYSYGFHMRAKCMLNTAPERLEWSDDIDETIMHEVRREQQERRMDSIEEAAKRRMEESPNHIQRPKRGRSDWKRGGRATFVEPTERRCFGCGGVGHEVSACPSNRGNGGNQEGGDEPHVDNQGNRGNRGRGRGGRGRGRGGRPDAQPKRGDSGESEEPADK